ncbi:MAG: peptide chain release factor 2 [Christensenellaceae bacterium]|jgi:peptide chain release factor 2|nr:peptide chain release factor 2 [Christensenellaceae bacterium]
MFELDNIKNLIEERRQELSAFLAMQEKDWKNIEVNKKVKILQEFLQEYESIKRDVTDFNELKTLMDEKDLVEERQRVEKRYDNFYIKTLLVGKYDFCDCVINITAGAGGTEAQDWAEIVMRMYTRFCEKQGFKYQIDNIEIGDGAGIKGASIYVSGTNAYGILKGEAGVHRLVRISPFDSNKRRHTSFVAVEIVPQIEKVELVVPDSDLRIDTLRANGAGGQHINKTESAVRITHLPTGISCIGQTCRSQLQNKDFAMKNLLSKLEYLHYENEQRKLKNLQPIQLKIEWGSQIRSYVLCPYTMVKDHRTGAETSNVQAVLDGDLQMFSDAFLLQQGTGNYGQKGGA